MTVDIPLRVQTIRLSSSEEVTVLRCVNHLIPVGAEVWSDEECEPVTVVEIVEEVTPTFATGDHYICFVCRMMKEMKSD